MRAGTVRRSSLLERLARDDVPADRGGNGPAGYGKTTLLSQWAERTGRRSRGCRWTRTDNDPKVLLTYVARALDAVEPIDGRVFDALTSPASSVPGSVVPRLGAAFAVYDRAGRARPGRRALIRNPECRAALSVLADHVPAGSRLVLAGRDEPPVRMARLRAEGRVFEIGLGDLSLTRARRPSLLRDAGVALGEDDVAEAAPTDRGVASGLYLAALYLQGGRFAGAGRAVVRRGRPAGQRVRGVGVPGADLPEAARVPDPCRGAGADVRANV